MPPTRRMSSQVIYCPLNRINSRLRMRVELAEFLPSWECFYSAFFAVAVPVGLLSNFVWLWYVRDVE